MANRSMNKSQEINDSIDSFSFDQDEADFWDEMYDYLDDCVCEDYNEDYFANF